MSLQFNSRKTRGRFVVWAVGWLVLGPAVLAAGPAVLFQWRPFLGPFHSILLHFPIGFVTMAFLVDLYALWRRKLEVQPVITLMLGLSVVSTGLTILLGLLRANNGEYDAHTLLAHRNFGIAVGGVTLGAFVFHWLGFWGTGHPLAHQLLRGTYRVLLLGDIGLLVVAGHEGGNLTHGSNYLTKNAPEFVRSLVEAELESEPETASVGEGTVSSNADPRDAFYLATVKPLLDTKCLGCHGPEKQKGKYRVDQPTVLLQGGDSGKVAITPGDPAGSQLVRLILLPPDHDDVMPPAGKSTLTPEEVMHLIHWIQQGAHVPGTHLPDTHAPDTADPAGSP